MSEQPAILSKHAAKSADAQQQMQTLLDELVADGRGDGIQVCAYRGEECVVDAVPARRALLRNPPR